MYDSLQTSHIWIILLLKSENGLWTVDQIESWTNESFFDFPRYWICLRSVVIVLPSYASLAVTLRAIAFEYWKCFFFLLFSASVRGQHTNYKLEILKFTEYNNMNTWEVFNRRQKTWSSNRKVHWHSEYAFEKISKALRNRKIPLEAKKRVRHLCNISPPRRQWILHNLLIDASETGGCLEYHERSRKYRDSWNF